MNSLYHLVLADFLERVRRYSFLITLAFAVYLGLAAATGQVSLRLGDYTGIPNSAWVGAVISMTISVFLSLVGFYIVSSSVQRDSLTRVGSILAATPMSRFAYTLAKALSNFAVLASMVAVLALVGISTVLIRAAAPVQLWPLLSPFLFIALPAMAIVAAVAVFFETTPILRSISSFLYFFLWIFSLASASQSGAFDPLGIHVISASMTQSLKALDPAYQGGFSFGIIVDDPAKIVLRHPFLWNGIHWTASDILGRLLLFPAAALIALTPALWFHRFDPSRTGISRRHRFSRQPATLTPEILPAMAITANLPPAIEPARLTLARPSHSALPALATLIFGELCLLVARRKWYIYAIAAGITLAGFLSPLSAAQGLLAAIFLLPMLVWSRLGAREDLFTTRSLIFTAPQASLRPLLAAWFAGAALPITLASGILLRLAIAGNFSSAIAILTGAFFVTALALALGALSRTPRLFEGIYIFWWYVGPLQGEPGLNFAGPPPNHLYPALWATLSIALIALAWFTRSARLRHA